MPYQEVFNAIPLLLWILLLAVFFAKVEINIEGDQGWAGSLPTWRIEKHWLLDIFWGGRPMTGYHAWLFSFIALAFHLVFFLGCKWSPQMEARTISSIILFWLAEDFLWFALNPAFGLKKFHPRNIHWHKKWFLFMPVDYWTFSIASALLLVYSYTS